MSLPLLRPRFARTGMVLSAGVICLVLARVVPHAYVAAAGVAAIAMIGLLLPPLIMVGMSASARLRSHRVTAGDRAELGLFLRGGWPLPMPGVTIAFSDAATGLRVIAGGGLLRRGSKSVVELHCRRRGVFSLDRLTLSTTFPFGLIKASTPIDATGSLIVWPKPTATSFPLLSSASSVSTSDAMSASFVDSGELAGVRAYRRGDAMRSVHWQQTARHDRLIVRERAEPVQRSCRVTIDTRDAMYDDADHFERAVSVAAGLIEQAKDESVSIDFHLNHNSIRVCTAEAAATALDWLAGVTTSSDAGPIARSGVVVTSPRGRAELVARGVVPLVVTGEGVIA